MRRLIVRGAAALVVAAAACGDDDGTGPGPTVASLTLAPDSASNATVLKSATLQLTPSAVDPAGRPIANPSVSYQTSDQTVATVSATGLVTAVGAGSATITATSGGKEAKATITVPYTLTQVGGQNIPTAVPGVTPPLTVTAGFAALYPNGEYRVRIDIQGSAPLIDLGTYTRSGTQLGFTSKSTNVPPGTGTVTANGILVTFPGPPALTFTFAR
jgi:hypothetical protein